MPKTSIYLRQADVALLEELAAIYGSKAEAIRAAMISLKKQKITQELSQKYKEEKPVPDKISRIQAETAADLGNYPW